jgi:VIT1/CCC1 family predicted Fe2+/Mn2+ transporter
MNRSNLSRETLSRILNFQRGEITEHHIYLKLASVVKNTDNAGVLRAIAADELRHYGFWKKHTGRDVKPSALRVFFFYWVSRVLGFTFGIKLMERGEEAAQAAYDALDAEIPGARDIALEENAHEDKLIAMLDEERLRYVGSIVLGLNDALVELTGTLAGLSFALQNTRLIALAGFITGIAASLSMAASEYLSTKHEGGGNPLKSSVYTGITYVVTVLVLIAPYLFLADYLHCLAATLGTAIFIILLFNFYISVAKDLPFARRFFEMAAISLGVAAISFGIGFTARHFIGIEA